MAARHRSSASARDGAAADRVVVAGTGAYRIVYRVLSVPLQFGEATIGSLELGTALDAAYVAELAQLSRGARRHHARPA